MKNKFDFYMQLIMVILLIAMVSCTKCKLVTTYSEVNAVVDSATINGGKSTYGYTPVGPRYTTDGVKMTPGFGIHHKSTSYKVYVHHQNRSAIFTDRSFFEKNSKNKTVKLYLITTKLKNISNGHEKLRDIYLSENPESGEVSCLTTNSAWKQK